MMDVSQDTDWDLGRQRIVVGDIGRLPLPCRKPDERTIFMFNVASLPPRTATTIWSHSCGELYTVGDCGQQMVTFNCRRCGAPAGGANHTALPGNTVAAPANQAARLAAEGKAGFLVGYSDHEPEPRPDWALTVWTEYGSPLNIYFAHLLTHLSLLYRELKQQT